MKYEVSGIRKRLKKLMKTGNIPVGFFYFPPGRKTLIDALGNCSFEVHRTLLLEYYKGELVKSTAFAIVHDDFL